MRPLLHAVRAAALLAAGALLACASPPTEAIVTLATDTPTRVLSVRIEAFASGDPSRAPTVQQWSLPADAGAGHAPPIPFPSSFALLPSADEPNDGRGRFDAIAQFAPINPGDPITTIRRTVAFTFIPNHIASMRIDLNVHCGDAVEPPASCTGLPYGTICSMSTWCEQQTPATTCGDDARCVAIVVPLGMGPDAAVADARLDATVADANDANVAPVDVPTGVDVRHADTAAMDVAPEACVPSCAGRACGTDGCAGSCGTCSGGATCDATGHCSLLCGDGVCAASESCASCAHDCACAGGRVCNAGACCAPSCAGHTCGADGCGGSCGVCSGGTACDGTGHCATVCGDGACVAGESCGNCAADCACAGGRVCTGSVCCAPACAGHACGPDGCGGSCGTCGAGSACNGGGACVTICGDGLCVAGETCASCAADCGCGTGRVCNGGACCTPACAGRVCGPDSCGGSCGTCSGTGITCNASGQCVAMCGDGACSAGENCSSCPGDCACSGTRNTCVGTQCCLPGGRSCSGLQHCCDGYCGGLCDGPCYNMTQVCP